MLYRILARQPRMHRYSLLRWAIGIVFTVGIALLPLTDTLRFDFWAGGHTLLGEQVELPVAAKAFAFPFLGVNIAIILVSRFLGRYLCGFVCPVGSLARLGEWLRFRTRTGAVRWTGLLTSLTICLTLALIVFSFWVDWRVFAEGSLTARIVSGTFLVGLWLGTFALVQRWGLNFCRTTCPSGVYFALLGQTTSNGVELRNPDACTDCGVCDRVCPMDLKPRELLGTPRDPAGLYGEGMSNHALCIRCGDCIVGCEEVGSRGEDIALHLGPLSQPESCSTGS